MNEHSVYNEIRGVLTPNLTEEQKSEIAKLISAYLSSQDFKAYIKALCR